MKGIGYIVMVIVAFTLVLALPIGVWYVGRQINYRFSYKALVQETVRDMVKAEALNP